MLTRDPLLAGRDGRLLLLSQALSFSAHGISAIALPWLVLDSGGSSTAAGLVFTFTVLPYVVFGLAAGIVGDRFPPRTVMWVTHALQALVALTVPLWTIGGTPPIALALAAGFAIGAGRAFSDAAVFGLLPPIAGMARLTHAQATLGAAWSVGMLAGPALGGVLVAAIGPARALAVEAACLAVAAVVIRLLRVGADRLATVHRSPLAVVRAGLDAIFGDELLRRLTVFAVTWVLVAAGAWGLVVPLLREEVGLSSGQVGVVLAAGGVAGILASPLVGFLTGRMGGVRIIMLGLPVVAVSMAACGVAPGFALAAVSVFVFYLSDSVITAAFIGERQRRAPLELQSTVGIFGRMIIMTAVTIGSAVASGLADAVDLRTLYVAMGAMVLVIGAVMGPGVVRSARRVALSPG